METLCAMSFLALLASALWVIHGPRKDQHFGAVIVLYGSTFSFTLSLIALMV